LSADTSSERLADFIGRHSENDLRVLILFKLVKTRVISAMQADQACDIKRVNSQAIDQFCLDKAKQLAAMGKDDPTEEEIKKLVALIVK
jgi:hypothetical protein